METPSHRNGTKRWIDIDPRGAIDHTMQGRTVTSYEPINGLHSMICISDAKVKEGRTRSNDSVALFGPGLISRRWHNGVVSEIACCFGSLPKAHTILHLSPEPDAFLPSWRGTVATVRVTVSAAGSERKAEPLGLRQRQRQPWIN